LKHEIGKNPLLNTIVISIQVDDIKARGKDAVQPHAHVIKEQVAPLRKWVRELQNLLLYLS
jgi:hypothetical protein